MRTDPEHHGKISYLAMDEGRTGQEKSSLGFQGERLFLNNISPPLTFADALVLPERLPHAVPCRARRCQ